MKRLNLPDFVTVIYDPNDHYICIRSDQNSDIMHTWRQDEWEKDPRLPYVIIRIVTRLLRDNGPEAVAQLKHLIETEQMYDMSWNV